MHLSRALTAKLAACILAVTAVITPSFAASVGTVVSDSGLNVRAEASAESQVFTTLSSGTQVDVLSTTGDGKWHKISSNGITGFVAGDYLKVTEEKIYGQVVAGPLNVRSGPSADAEKVDSLSVGTIVEIEELIGGAGGWYQIEGGYISSEFAEKRFSLNEARKLDVRAMVLNYYDNPGVSNVTNYLNIRQGAGKNEKVIGKLPSYAGCEILEDTGNGWYKIRSGNITGYVSSEFILTGDAARQAAMEHAELMAIVSTDRLNARTEPSTDAKIWTQISNNERYHVAEQLDGWVKIEFDEGGEGDGADEVSAAYVSTDYVDVRYALAEAIKFSPAEESASLRSQVVNYAMQFLGNPYVYGGTSLTEGADCSGFTMKVFEHFGISTGRSSRDQAAKGKEIPIDSVQPGDLLFYASGDYINHVALYIGGGQIIHASTPKNGIMITTAYYRTPYKAVTFLN